MLRRQVIPPGDDLIEKELRRIFDVEDEESWEAGTDSDELMLMYKLRKELGDDDFVSAANFTGSKKR